MLKKLSRTTNFILIGIVVGLFIGVSIRQALGDETFSGTVRADNLTVNTSRIAGNGLAVDFGNLLVPNGKVGIGTMDPSEALTVTGKVLSSGGFCIGTGVDVTCITRDQLQALLSGDAVPGPGLDNTSLCSGISAPFSGGKPDGVKPFVCSGKSMRSANGEFIYALLGEAYLPYVHKTEHDECVATSPLPNQLQIVSSPNGCKLQGVVYGSGKFTFAVNNEFGSATGDYTIIGYTPDVTLTFPSTCSGSGCKLCPDARVGEPFSCTIGVGTTGDWTGSKIGFSLSWGAGGDPGGLGLWDIYNNGVETITTPEPTDAQKTAVISGTPTKAGTYQLSFCAGNSTKAHAAFCLVPYSTFVVKLSTDLSSKVPVMRFEKLTYHRGETLKGSITGGDPNDTWACMDSPNTVPGHECTSGWTNVWRKLTVPYDGHADEWKLVKTDQGNSIQLDGLLIEQGFPLGTYTQYVKTGQWGTPSQTTSKSITVQ